MGELTIEGLSIKLEHICDDVRELKEEHEKDIDEIKKDNKETQKLLSRAIDSLEKTVNSLDKNMTRLTDLTTMQVKKQEAHDKKIEEQDVLLHNIDTQVQLLASRSEKSKTRKNDVEWYRNTIKVLIYSLVVVTTLLGGLKLADVLNLLSFIN